MRSLDVNDYVKEVAGNGFSAKDFRTWHGTVLAAVSLALGGPVPAGVTARRRAITAAVKDVAEFLGNTPAVARASYVDPRLFDRFNEGRTVRGSLERAGLDRDRVGRRCRPGRPGDRRGRGAGSLEDREPSAPGRLSARFALPRTGQANPGRGRKEASCASRTHNPRSPRRSTSTCSSPCSTMPSARSRKPIPYVLIGGIGSAVFGRDRGTRDIDLFVRPETAGKVLSVLDDRGFDTDEFAELALQGHEARRARGRDLPVRDILLGDEMLERSG